MSGGGGPAGCAGAGATGGAGGGTTSSVCGVTGFSGCAATDGTGASPVPGAPEPGSDVVGSTFTPVHSRKLVHFEQKMFVSALIVPHFVHRINCEPSIQVRVRARR